MPARTIPAATAGHLLGGQSEEKEVFLARCLGHLDCRAIASSDSQSTIHHELHIAGAARFIASRRNLVRHIRSWNKPFGERHAIFGKENDLHPLVDGGIAID